MKKIKNEIENEFKKFFNKNKFLPTYKLGDFEEWDSISHINLFLTLEKKFKIKFSVSEMLELKSIKEITKAIKKRNEI